MHKSLLALCDGGQAPEFTVAIGGTADAEGRAARGAPDAIDPQPSSGHLEFYQVSDRWETYRKGLSLCPAR